MDTNFTDSYFDTGVKEEPGIKTEPRPPFIPGSVPVPPGMEEMYKDAPGKSTATKNDVNVNVTFKREKREPPEEKDPNKRMKYHVSKHIDTNRDLYFVKLVAGALKRRHFQTLIEVEEERERPRNPLSLSSAMDVFVKYSYSYELLHAWTTVIEKVKKMVEPSILLTNPNWSSSEEIHTRLIENDTAVTAFARNRTRYVLEVGQQIEGQRVFDVMRALHTEFHVLNTAIAEKYGIV